ncbi:nucleoside triphosphate pyrophosphohydrolase [Candidatus Chloroploca sp. M-50]|uniref:Nucleoside triphosphate pyrophosphohydrolase n=1 Tax=Candidatus Chloroploca mongolica TaxID=2528176 RepID=A0ABS4D8Y1_9CHLR|nr:nucleoside triphosphate pyrophosphohydrolase [Candidatus Chloroploca mongolica]MBP1465886.1 nucleoside triphosphate pyrophosphohydrolase [Candidatus Chloroploca mongolica]
MNVTPGQLLDAALRIFALEGTSGVQFWEAHALLAASQPPGLPQVGHALGVRPWAETMQAGSYRVPVMPFPLQPVAPALIWWHHDDPSVPLHDLLALRYPPHHLIRLAILDSQGRLRDLVEGSLTTWPELVAQPGETSLLAVDHLPVNEDQRSADGLRWVMTRLLGPEGCPWDVRQSHADLRSALIEETCEVLEALDTGDMEALKEELGDLLISIFAHCEMARQAGYFTFEDVFAQVTGKLIGRHPHVFGNLVVDGEHQVLQNWEQIKATELAAKGRTRAGTLDGVPPELPALATAQKIGKRAARTGFNWTGIDQVWAKINEELDELRAAAASADPAHIAEEFGDTLFVLTRLAAWLQIDAELALRDANLKFRRRFGQLEATVAAQGHQMHALSLDEMIRLWQTVK